MNRVVFLPVQQLQPGLTRDPDLQAPPRGTACSAGKVDWKNLERDEPESEMPMQKGYRKGPNRRWSRARIEVHPLVEACGERNAPAEALPGLRGRRKSLRREG